MPVGWRALSILCCSSAVFGTVAEIGCQRGGKATPSRPNVILISLDTVRADHTSLYGYARPTTTALEGLARQATRYTRAMASSSWTLPTHVSMFTGLLPVEHGAHFYPPRGKLMPLRPRPIDGSQPTLPSALRAVGYQTGGFVANAAYLAKRWGFARGFDRYFVGHGAATMINEQAVEWLERGSSAPFFLFLNYMDAHVPMNVAPRPDVAAAPAPDGGAEMLVEFRKQQAEGRLDAADAIRRALADTYDTGIANADAGVGEILDWLKQNDLFEEALIVVTSDHGEFHGEHELVGHPQGVYQPGVHVPLLVKAPGQTRARDEDVVVMTHELPALLLGHVDTPEAREQARHFPRRPGEGPSLAELYYESPITLRQEGTRDRFDRVRRALFAWPYKLIHSSDGAHELYDLELDPEERVDLARDEPDLLRRLARRVEPLIPADGGLGLGVTSVQRLDPKERAALEALGYKE